MIEIIPFEEKYEAAFKALNLVWLDEYQLTESHDLMVLNDPRATIIDNGGTIFLARIENEIVGTAALMKEKEGEFELAKMTVAEKHRGKGISKLLMMRCLEAARSIKATKISLFSNHQLQTAIALYKQFGFEHVPVVHSPFETADIKMELMLK